MTRKKDSQISQGVKELEGKHNNRKIGNKVYSFSQFIVFLDKVFAYLMGELRKDVYETVQDAIALSVLLQIPGWVFKLITGEDYSGFDQCMEGWNQWNVNRYACFVIVASGFTLWIVISGRIIFRLYKSLYELAQKRIGRR